MKKIIVIGLTGSGKTTLSNKIGGMLDIPVHHLDKIFWKEKGGIKQDVFLAHQENIMLGDKWIMDGSFPRSKTLEVRIQNADTIIFYHIPLWLNFLRRIKRYKENQKIAKPDLVHEKNWPLTWKEIKYALAYPTKEIYSRILPLSKNKNVFIIKNRKDEESLIDRIKKLQN